jgi:ribose transport system ATP-binding protein
MLQLQELSKAFGSTRAVDGVSFAARPGRVLALIGENGSGKSTVLRLLAGETVADAGQMRWDAAVLRPEEVHLVHQELLLCPHLTAAENLFLGSLKGVGFSPKQVEARARELLSQLGFSEIEPGRITRELPVSQRQVIEIGRAFVKNCPVILLDEPTSSMTEADKLKFYRLVRTLREAGKTVIFISHFLEEVRAVSDDYVILRDGKAVADGELSAISDAEIVRYMVGREVNELFPRSDRALGEVVVSIQNLSGQGSKPQNVSLEVRAGEVVGLAGLNGAGKTELLRTVFGLRKRSSGTCFVLGEQKAEVGKLWRRGVGFVSEERKEDGLSLRLSIAENATMPMRRGFLARPGSALQRGESWIKSLRIASRSASQPVGDLSGGNQQKVAFARLLNADCKLLILDEPTRGVDVGSKAEIYRLMDEAAQSGAAILLASSYLPELLGVCDRIGVMNRGQLTRSFEAKSATSEAIIEECLR